MKADRLAAMVASTYEEIVAAGEDLLALDRAVRRLEGFVLDTSPDPALEIETLARLSPRLIAGLQQAYGRWETQLERRFVEEVQRGAKLDDYPLAGRFRGLIRRELGLLPTPPRSLLFIGSGPMPISALLFSELTGSEVTCVDVDARAVEESRRLVARLSPGALQVVEAAGEDVEAGRFDTVVVALLAKPKNRILAHLATSVGSQSRVLCRTSAGLRTLLYEPPGVSLSRHFNVAGCQSAEGDLTISTTLLRPRAERP